MLAMLETKGAKAMFQLIR